MKSFDRWLNTFVSEKELDTDYQFQVEGVLGTNFIPLACVLEAIKSATPQEQKGIKDTIIRIDFRNGDVMHFFNHLAKALAL